jgi:tetratricopeptide (TPR) repeat protein
MKIAAWAAALVLTAATSVWAQTAAPPKSQADVLYAEAVAAHKKLDLIHALDFYNQYLALKPDAPNGLFNRGQVYRGLKKYDEALADYNKAIALSPSNGAFYFYRGMNYLAQNKCDAAIADYTQAFNHDVTIIAYEIYNARASCWLTKKEYAKAIDDYSRAISANVGDDDKAASYTNRGLAKRFSGDETGAIADYNSALQLEPHKALILSNLAAALAATGDYDAALADIDQAIATEPTGRHYASRGLRHQEKGQYDMALADYAQAMKLDPSPANAPFYLRGRSQVYLYQKDFDRALADMDAALVPAPHNSFLLASRCEARGLANRDLDAAMTDCQAALAADPDTAEPLDHLGFIWFRKGEFDKAIAQYDLALAAKPLDPLTYFPPDPAQTLYRRGLAKLAKGDAEGGKADIAQALTRNPHAADEMAHFGIQP